MKKTIKKREYFVAWLLFGLIMFGLGTLMNQIITKPFINAIKEADGSFPAMLAYLIMTGENIIRSALSFVIFTLAVKFLIVRKVEERVKKDLVADGSVAVTESGSW